MRKEWKWQMIIGVVFLVAFIYAISTLSLIGHRPIVIFLTEGIAVVSIGVTFGYSLFGKRKEVVLKKLGVAVILCFLLYGITELLCNQSYQNKVKHMVVEEIDLLRVLDGTYIGESNVDYIKVKVKVEVKAHQIVKIELLEHRNERGKKAEMIVNKIIEKQELDVDTVTSATNSSKVIKKAVENALLQGIE